MKKNPSLNHTYKLVWSDVLASWVAVSETTKGKGKSKSQKVIDSTLSAILLLGVANTSFADPTGGQVTSGSATITQSANTTTITQNSQNVNINWDSFNIHADQTVNFVQPNSVALAVNRIYDTNGSSIMGHLNANGRVWLINPNGVFFGQGAQVNVGALLASTLNPLSNTDDANQVFGNGGTASIINQGNINANGGYVAFIANSVSNQGNIIANNGTVALAAGSQVSLKFADNQLLSLSVDQSTLNNLVENKQLIQVDGGAVLLSAGAKDSLLASVVNNEGIIEAKTVEHKEGKIVLSSNYGMMNTGSLKATGDSGGQISIDTKNLIDAGSYDVSASTQGGVIDIKASNHIEQTASASLNANASHGKAGTISIAVGSDAFLSSTLSANGNSGNGQGGKITVTAPNLTLAAANVSATGGSQGGQVAIGGGMHGSDANITNANITKVVASHIDVSATDTGNAGTAVVWSEQATTLTGEIKATGGKTAGDGGMVEVSSANTLNFGASVDASATQGKAIKALYY